MLPTVGLLHTNLGTRVYISSSDKLDLHFIHSLDLSQYHFTSLKPSEECFVTCNHISLLLTVFKHHHPALLSYPSSEPPAPTMSLRQNLTKPLVVDPTGEHTHTVVFLHRFPADTTEEELRGKVLARKLTKDHRTLQEQFPAVRWVFPHPKAHARHWGNLSAEDKAELGLDLGGLPYITQVVIQESKRAGGLDRVILGGQGETAEAAHEAMSSFPELRGDERGDHEAVVAFIQEYFHPSWTDIGQLKLAGFVGMHAQGGTVTRDAKNLGIASKLPGVKGISTAIVTNTPHRFIQGGYKVQTTTWDGKRIDDFAGFLVDIGVHRTKESVSVINGDSGLEPLTPKDRSGSQSNGSKKADAKEELNDVQKHALLIMREKKATEETRNKILHRIEADKVERKIRQERRKQARHALEEKLEAESRSGPALPEDDHGGDNSSPKDVS